jgi:hypothetical protein
MDGVEENAKALSLARIDTSERLLRRLVVEAVRRLVRSFLDRGRWRRDRRHLAALWHGASADQELAAAVLQAQIRSGLSGRHFFS